MSGVLLDTHAWVWWLSEPAKLSPAAADAIAGAATGEGIHVSSMSAWEVAMLVHKGRLVLDREVRRWVADAVNISFVRMVPVQHHVAVNAVLLEGLHGDPVDRLLAATALDADLSLVTADRKLRDYPALTTIW